MITPKRFTVYFLIIVFAFSFQLKANSNLSNLFENIKQQPLSSTHPDYPIAVIQKAIKAEQTNKLDITIKLLENLREQVLFDGVEKELSTEQKLLFVGTYGSFKLWRELAYVLLSRAYYAKKWYNLAIDIYHGIPDSSIFADFKKVGLGWAYLATNQLDNVEQLLQSPPKNQRLSIEHSLQKALFFIRKGEFKKGFDLSESVIANNQNLSAKILAISFKIYAEAGMHYWLKNTNNWSFKENISILEKVIEISKKIELENCDGDCLFFIAEAWWNLASLYRVQDPVKYQPQWQAALQKANQILSPLVSKSIKTKLPLLSEEAFFLSIAISWELNSTKQSILRLQAFPQLYPMGKYKEDIYQLLGDYYFDRKNFVQAIKFYRKLVQIGNSEKSAYGIYKAAWAFYNNNQRWEALRHIERLLLYFDKTTQLPGKESSILKEAKRDMLLFLAELLPAKKSLQEFNLFSYSQATYLNSSEELALTYKRIGKYSDAIEIFRTLLTTKPKQIRSFYWLEELVDTQLRQGRREQIASSFRHFYPTLTSEETDESNKHRKQLINKFAKVILTIHREARKTSTKRNWEAVDQAYDVFNSFFKTHSDGTIWYHGAQRFEQRERNADAITWYQRSALQKDFINNLDAAQSVLRITKNWGEQLGLEKETTHAQHLKISSIAKWYIKNFAKTPQRHLADHIYIEQLYNADNFLAAAGHLQSLFKQQGPSQENINKLQIFYSIIERNKQWQNINQLATLLLSALKDSESSFVNDLKQMQQESAFQHAFFSSKDKVLSRRWYRKAIAYNYNPDLTLKSWHNYFLSFSLPLESEQLIVKYQEFPSLSIENDENKKLLYAIKIHLANAYFHQQMDLKSARMAIEAGSLAPNSPQIERLRFNATITLGQHGDFSSFEKQVKHLHEQSSSLIKKQKNLIFIARLYLWNNQSEKSWNSLFPLLEKNIRSEEIQFLLRDLFFFTLNNNRSLHLKIKEWISKNTTFLKKQISLTELWDNFVAATSLSEIKKWNSISDVPETLKEKAGIIKNILNQFNQKQKLITNFLKTAGPLQQMEAICYLPKHREAAIKDLVEIQDASKEQEIKAFYDRLTLQISEYNKLQQKEQAFCKTQINKTVYLSSNCIWSNCLSINDKTAETITDEQLDILQKHQQPLDRAYYLIANQLTSLAYRVANNTKEKNEKLFIYAMIRLAHQDSWNASLILKELIKVKSLKSQASLLLAWLAYKQENSEIAKTYLSNVDSSSLSEWQKELFDEIDI